MNDLKNLEIEIYAFLKIQNDVLVDGEIELLMTVLPELLTELKRVTDVV